MAQSIGQAGKILVRRVGFAYLCIIGSLPIFYICCILRTGRLVALVACQQCHLAI